MLSDQERTLEGETVMSVNLKEVGDIESQPDESCS